MSNRDHLKIAPEELIPKGEVARQAIDSLRGYAYQITAAALAWLDIETSAKLFLEVAEDYAVVARGAINTVQVKDTQASGAVTLNSKGVRDAIDSFVALTELNSTSEVYLRYLTTSVVGTEKELSDRPGGIAGLLYWRRAAQGAEVKPLRELLTSDRFSQRVRDYVGRRTDEELRRELLRRVHWDCGQPNLQALQAEFHERLTVIGRDAFNIPSQHVSRVSGNLLLRVLEQSIAPLTEDRVLTRAGLIKALDEASRVSIPLQTVEALAAATGVMAQMFAAEGSATGVALGAPGWIVDCSELPPNARAVSRGDLELSIEGNLRDYGCCFVVGGSGLGKSSTSRLVAEKLGKAFIVDFRSLGAGDAKTRLDLLLARVGGLKADALILEDLNVLADPAVVGSFSRVLAALARRDIALVATSYNRPPVTAVSRVGASAKSIVECPYFSEEEAGALVKMYGGQPRVWGKLAFVSGAFGHPQLVHAFIMGMEAKGWPRSEIPTIIESGLSTGDIDSERDAARRTLVSHLSAGAKSLLYRLSLLIGTFGRTEALSLASAPPPLTDPGEALDALVGPWVETVGRDKYRVSPLVSQTGKEMLSPAEQRSAHNAIATQLMAGRSIDAGDVDKIVMHAIFGRHEFILLSLAGKILTSGSKIVDFLAESLSIIRIFDTSKPIYPDNLYVSVLLRVVQFKILAAAKDANASKCATTLFRELASQPDNPGRDLMEIFCLGTVLGTMGVANHLDDWVDRLFQLREALKRETIPSDLRVQLEQAQQSANVIGVLFAIGSSGLNSVARLEEVFGMMDHRTSNERALLLELTGEVTPDYSVLVNSPWLNQQATIDAADAAERYRRMAKQTALWGERSLSVQCWVARAIMLDEFAADPAAALKVVDDAISELGADIRLSRAQAKIYWRAQDHARALQILRGIADDVGKGNNVERAFALREAAISASLSGDWIEAERWFEEAAKSAYQARVPDMQVMSIGLRADGAVAMFHRGHIDRCLDALADALESLTKIEATLSLRATHCHHLVRHTVLWIRSQVEGREIEIGGEPIAMRPGACSEPEPVQEIAERPLGSLDIAWYMLAEAEIASRAGTRIRERMAEWETGRGMPLMEVGLRLAWIASEIEDQNATRFSEQLLRYVGAMSFLAKNAELFRSGDYLNPLRGDIPLVDSDAVYPSLAGYADDALLAYLIKGVCAFKTAALSDLLSALEGHVGRDFLESSVLAIALPSSGAPSPKNFEDSLVATVIAWSQEGGRSPKERCVMAVRFHQQLRRSNFRGVLTPAVASWLRTEWTEIVEQSAFQLEQPRKNVPAIESALRLNDGDERAICALLLAASAATGLLLPKELHAELIAAS